MTPYMSLDLPVVTVTLGPEWATLLNAALTVVDNHDHTTGRGRPITSAAININDDLAINTYNLRNARSYNMQNLGTPIAGATDIRSLYSVDGELYFNDGVGNQVRLTLNGAIDAASVGGIGGDYATSSASVTYSSISKTFTFNQNTNKRAKLEVGDLIVGDTSTTSPNEITIKSPSGLAASYPIRLPTALPASTLPLVMANNGDVDPSQILTAMIATDGVTNTNIQDGAVTTTKIADANVTQAKLEATAIDGSLVRVTYVTGSGTFVVPAGVTRIIISGIGGGGGGGNGPTSNGGAFAAGGGGGGGAGSHGIFVKNVSVGESFTYVIGAGGAANGTGGTSQFGDLFFTGGAGGIPGESGTTGAGGIGGSPGLFAAPGGNAGAGGLAAGGAGGQNGSAGYGDHGGAAGGGGSGGAGGGGGGGGGGGASIYAAGGAGGRGQNGGSNVYTTPPGLGSNGSGGGGGGGPRSNTGNGGQAGAQGGDGRIEVFYFQS